MVLARLYMRYKEGKSLKLVLNTMSAAIVALIGAAALTLLKPVLFDGKISFQSINLFRILLVACAFALLRFTKTSPILIMIGCGILYALVMQLLV